MSPADIATLTIAALGLYLGIRSEWRAHRHDAIRLRVIPKVAYPLGPLASSEPRIAIEVINESRFAVTIDEVGFEVRGERNRFAITLPLVGDGKPWPRRLEPFDAVIAYGVIDARFLSMLPRMKQAYASTTTGHTKLGNSKALRTISRLGAIPPFTRPRPSTGQPGYVNLADLNE